MSSLEVSVRLNPSFDDWYGARNVVEEELKVIGEALERIRISSRLQDAFTGHLLAVHHQWCKACPSSREHGGLPGGGLGLEKEAPTAEPMIHTRAAAAHNPSKQKTSRSYMSTFTQTTDIANGPQMNTQDEVDDNNDDISETSVPSSKTCRLEDEESQADVNRTLEKPSTEKVVSTKFIKLEVLEDEQIPDMLLKLEKDHCDVDMDSSQGETPSQQIHEEEEPSQPIKSGEQSHWERTKTVSDQRIKHEKDSQSRHDLDTSVAGSSSEAITHQGPVEEVPLDRSDGTNNSTLHCDVLGHRGVSTDQCTANMDSYKKVERTSRSEDTSKGVIATCTPKSPDTKSNSDSVDINWREIKETKRLKTIKRKIAVLEDDEQSIPSTSTPKHARHNDITASALDNLDSLKIDALHDIAAKMCQLTESVNTFSQKLLNIKKSQQRQDKLLKYTSKVVHKLKPTTEQIPNGVDGEFTNTADQGRSTDSREIMFVPLEHEISSGKVEIASTYKIDLKEYSTAVHRAKRGKDDDERGRIFCLHIVKLLIPQDILSTHNATGKTRNPMTKKWSSIPKLDDRLLAGVMEKAKHHFPNFSDSLHSKNSKTVYSINTLCKRARTRKDLSNRYQAEDSFDEFVEID